MSDPVSPTVAAIAVCTGGLPCIVVLQALGMDPINMLAGLAGVVIVQAFIPSKSDPNETTKAVLRRVILTGSASMFVAAWGGPLLAAALIGAMPSEYQWIKTLPTENIKAISAGIAGGFAQPWLLWVQSMLPKRPAPTIKEE